MLAPDNDPVYFTDPAGVKWRVHAVAFGPPHGASHHYRKFAVSDQRAVSHIFVSALTERRSHPFGKRETREISPELCTRQIARARYLARSEFDATSRGPR